jgi:hypothetical protein
MADVNISKYRAQVVREGSTPASPGFVVSEGQNPVDPSGSGQTHLPVTIAAASTGLSITESQVLGGAGTVAQYIRGDGSLADFPESSGGGSSVSYYLNGSVSQGTIGGVAYLEMNKVPILGAGTDFTRNSNGYIASFITDTGDPNLLEIPGGNWNFESYFSASSGGGSPTFYVELYKVNAGGTATLIASNSANPELISFGTTIAPYFSSLAVPTTVLALTDRLAVRYYVTPGGRTLTLHTEGPHLCQIITTFTTGITALNGLTSQVQFFAVGTSGTDFNIASATATHTFNLPTASATNRGALSSSDWSVFNSKIGGSGTSGQVAYFNGTSSITGESSLFWDATNDRLGIGTASPATRLMVQDSANTFVGHFSGLNQTNGIAIGTNSGNVALIQGYTRTFSATNSIALQADDGNLLVGTTTDNGAKFQVAGSASFTGNVLMGFNNALRVGDSPYRFSIYRSSAGNLITYFDDEYDVSNTSIRFRMRTSGTPIEALTIASSGNLLVGTTTDAGFRLDVNGTARVTGVATFSSTLSALKGDFGSAFTSTNVLQAIAPSATNSDMFQVGMLGVSNGFTIKRVSSVFNYAFNDGNVGIRTDSPTSTLQVAGSFSAPHVTKSANYTLDATDYTVGFDCASNRTATLPDATTCQGRIYVIYQYNTGSGARSVTLDGNGSQTINGVTTYSLSPFCEYTSVMIQSNGANWIIISSNFTTDCL